jgi:hypothetical protein
VNRYYDKEQTEALKDKVGDLIFLNSKNLQMQGLVKKFDHTILGLFRNTKIISPMVMQLDMLESWTIYPEFHIKLLEPHGY